MKKGHLFLLSASCLSVVLVGALLTAVIALAQSSGKPTKEVRVGATVAYSWRGGQQIKKCLEMLVDQANASGGIRVGGERYSIKFFIYDDKYSSEGMKAAAERLVHSDKVQFIVFAANYMQNMVDITDPNKVVVFHGSTHPKLYDPKYKYVEHTYSQMVLTGGAKLVKEYAGPNAKTMVILAHDDPVGKALAPRLQASYGFAGLKIIETLWTPSNTQDFSTIAAKVVSLNPDFFMPVAMMAGAESLQCTKAIVEANYKGLYHLSYPGQEDLDGIVKKLGKQSIEGAVTTTMQDPLQLPIPPKGAKEFRDEYVKRYGRWETEALPWLAGWYVWREALERANSIDPDKVMSVLDRNFSTTYPMGKIVLLRRPNFNNNRYVDIAGDCYLFAVRDGILKLVKVLKAEEAIQFEEQMIGMSLR